MHHRLTRAVARLSLLAIAASVLAVIAPSPVGAVNAELLFSEYIEGSSNNKALEIFNDTGAAVNLATGAYDVQMFFNGGLAAGLTIPLTGTIADDDVYVVAQSLADAVILAEADQTSSAAWFNGDDAIVLRKAGVVIDSIGDVGFDPGTEWGTGSVSTADNTIRRKLTVTAGDTVVGDDFDPSVEWDGFAVNTFDGLGSHGEEPPNPCATLTPYEIAEVQGAADATPLAGCNVRIEGVVTGDFNGTNGLGGFYIQDDTPDANPATSEGIFVFSNSAVSAGDRVRVDGTASEGFNQTQVTPTAVSVIGTGTITATSYDLPRPEGTTFEPVESMLLTFPEALTVTELFELGRFGELTVSADGRLIQPTDVMDPGPAAAAAATAALRRALLIDDASNVMNPPVVPYLPSGGTTRIGDSISDLTGVLGYGFSSFRLQPTAPVTIDADNPRPAAPAEVGGDITVASFNTLNYFTTLTTENSFARGADSPEELARQQIKEVEAITGIDADVIGLMEVENNGAEAVQSLVDLLNDEVGAGTYAFITEPVLNPPTTLGGEFGTDAIKVALIYKPAVVTPVGGAQTSDDDIFDRPPLIQTFERVGGSEDVTVIVNHFKSKGSCPGSGIDADQGDGQSCWNNRRILQATELLDVIETLAVPNALIIGDLNSYTEEDPIHVLENAGYVGLSEQFMGDAERYSYVFDGFSGELDHGLASPDLADNVTGATIWHINADEPTVLDYNLNFNPPGLFQPNAYRTSDHDPLVIGLTLALDITAPDAPTVEATMGWRAATVDWTVTDDGGSAITGFQLDITQGATPVVSVALGPDVTSYTLGQLKKGVTYDFAVVATNAIGSSPAGTDSGAPFKPVGPVRLDAAVACPAFTVTNANPYPIGFHWTSSGIAVGTGVVKANDTVVVDAPMRPRGRTRFSVYIGDRKQDVAVAHCNGGDERATPT